MQFIVASIISIAGIVSSIFIAVWQQRQSRIHPYLVPMTTLPFSSSVFDHHLSVFEIRLKNSGSSSAGNICGVVFGSKRSEVYILQGKASLPEKETAAIQAKMGLDLGDKEWKIGQYDLHLPEETQLIGRLTLLYEDNAGRKYIGIFDYIGQDQWQQVKFLQNVRKDIKAIYNMIRSNSAPQFINSSFFRIDLGDAPNVENFYGREKECTELIKWIAKDHCQLVAILGIGGVGKTALSAKLAEEMLNEFTYVLWRSLHNAPPLISLLERSILFLSNQQQLDLPKEVDDLISLLIDYLQKNNCLLVLDNFETVLQGGNRIGRYRDGYEGYGRLIQRIGEAEHRSCLLLTSREKPKEVARLEGKVSSVRSLELLGVGLKEGQEILKDKGLDGSDEMIQALIHLYSGNPLALKLVSEPIQGLFGGNIVEFLKEKEIVFGDIYDLLDQQFHRLSELEQSMLYWLTIERETVSLEGLRNNIVDSVQKGALLGALDSLQRRSMIETSSKAFFTLQPVIMEYVTDRFIEQVCEAIENGAVRVVRSHALIKAQTKDYVRDSQIRLILTPIKQRLLITLGKEGIQEKFRTILAMQRDTQADQPSYIAGNILNLLIHLKYDLQGFDFSHLQIWQAYLQDVALQDVNFAHATFTNTVFTDAFGSIFSIVLSSNGKVLAAGTATGDIRLWESTSGTPLGTCLGHADWVRSVAFSPDGQILASGSDDQTVKLWEISTGQCLKTLQEHIGGVTSVAFSPDGQVLASGSDDRTIKIWETPTGQCLKTLQEHTSRVTSVIFGSDGQTLVSGSEDRTVKFWAVSIGQCLKTLHGYANGIRSLTFSPDGRVLASGGLDHTARFWEIDTGQCLKILQGHTNGVMSVGFSPDCQTLATGSEDQTVKLWEVSSGRCLKTLQGHTDLVWSVAFSPDGQVLVTGSLDQTVRFWEISTKRCLKILQGHTSGIRCAIFNPDGQVLASGSEDRTIKLWEVSTGSCLKTLRGHTSWIKSLAYSPDGQTLASGSDDRTVRLWEINNGQCLKTLEGHTNWVMCVAFSPDGRILASGGGDRSVKLWETSTWQCLRTLHGHTDWVWSVAFRPDSQMLASSSSDGIIKYWNVQTGECLRTLRSDRPYERMNISDVKGLTEVQKVMLKALGATEN